MRHGFTVLLALGCLLAACRHGPDSDKAPKTSAGASDRPGAGSTSDPAQRSFHTARYGFTLDVAPDLQLTRGFKRGDLANSSWKAYAGPGSKGQSVVMLVLPGSNHVTAAELRIGASRDRQAVSVCTDPPSGVTRSAPVTRTLGGVTFTYFEAADAAMSHYMQTHSYRAVHAGACIAIDLVVTGTRPDVYDPPAKPPFTQAQAFARLRNALNGFHFER